MFKCTHKPVIWLSLNSNSLCVCVCVCVFHMLFPHQRPPTQYTYLVASFGSIYLLSLMCNWENQKLQQSCAHQLVNTYKNGVVHLEIGQIQCVKKWSLLINTWWLSTDNLSLLAVDSLKKSYKNYLIIIFDPFLIIISLCASRESHFVWNGITDRTMTCFLQLYSTMLKIIWVQLFNYQKICLYAGWKKSLIYSKHI